MMPRQGDMAGYAAFEGSRRSTKRNRGMIASADAFLSQGNAFVAVKLRCLPGPEGLVEGFRKAGYTVSADAIALPAALQGADATCRRFMR